MKLLYGSQNFGYDIAQSDKDWLEFVYPTWEEIASNSMRNYEHKNKDGSITKVKDIRLIIKMIEKANFNDLQILYSQEVYDCDDLKWFTNNRDALVKHNMSQLFHTNKGYILNCLKSRTQKDLVKALAFTDMVLKAFEKDEFVMRDPMFGKMREGNNIDFETGEEYIYKKLLKYDDFTYDFSVNKEIVLEAKQELIKLISLQLIR